MARGGLAGGLARSVTSASCNPCRSCTAWQKRVDDVDSAFEILGWDLNYLFLIEPRMQVSNT